MTKPEMLKILDDVECSIYTFEIGDKNGTLFLQASYNEPDSYTGKDELQKTRKWLLSEHMTKGELVQTAFKCIMTSFEHRAREAFAYKGKRIFGPHFDIDVLVEVADQTIVRKEIDSDKWMYEQIQQ